jgi:hypothetical protein
MPGLFSVEQAARLLQGVVGRNAERLVEQQHAIEAPSRGATKLDSGLAHSSRRFLSDSTASSISFESRAPS